MNEIGGVRAERIITPKLKAFEDKAFNAREKALYEACVLKCRQYEVRLAEQTKTIGTLHADQAALSREKHRLEEENAALKRDLSHSQILADWMLVPMIDNGNEAL